MPLPNYSDLKNFTLQDILSRLQIPQISQFTCSKDRNSETIILTTISQHYRIAESKDQELDELRAKNGELDLQMMALEDRLYEYENNDEQFDAKVFHRARLMAKEDELKKQAATAKQIKTKLDNRIMKMNEELKKEKEDNDYLQGELDKFKGLLKEKNEQNAAIQRDRDCMEQKFL